MRDSRHDVKRVEPAPKGAIRFGRGLFWEWAFSQRNRNEEVFADLSTPPARAAFSGLVNLIAYSRDYGLEGAA